MVSAMRWSLLFVVVLFCVSFSSFAQGDNVTNSTITYGETVQDTITVESYYDLWAFYGTAGDEIHVEMVAADGLAPLIGLLDSTRSLIARSDEQPDGTLVDAEPDGIAVLRFTLPVDGEYVITATRVGNADGTTIGSYALSLNLNESAPVSEYQDVTFLCGRSEVTTAASFEIYPDEDQNYRITVHGLDGFDPVLRYKLPESEDETVCAVSEDGLTIQLEMQNVENWGIIQLTVGSRDNKPGRYQMVIEGFSIDPAGDQDSLIARLGPFARDTAMTVYMVRANNTRIDPTMTMTLPSDENISCDDAGRRGCEDVASAAELEIELGEARLLTGQRFDAGLKIETGTPDPVLVTLSSRTTSTHGVYYVVILGELQR